MSHANLPNVATEGNTIFKQIKAYPNPTSDLITIDLGNEYTTTHVKILSHIGQLVAIGKYSHSQFLQIKMPDIRVVYFVNISLPNGETTSIKVVKE